MSDRDLRKWLVVILIAYGVAIIGTVMVSIMRAQGS